MWRSTLKQSIRYLLNQGTHSIIVIIGLSVGIASSFLIYSYVHNEMSYDSFHKNGENLYRVVVTARLDGQDPYKSPYSYAPQGPVAKQEIPDIEEYVRLMDFPNVVLTTYIDGEETVINNGDYYYADDTFFSIFSFPLINGDPETVLAKPGTVVISRSIAQKLYGDQNPVGKTMKVDGKYTMTVTGVFEEVPENSHLKFNLLFSLNTFPWIMNEGNAWSNHSFYTYLLLNKDADPNLVAQKITKAYHKEDRAIHQANCSWQLQPIVDAYLNTSTFTSKPESFKFGDERMVYFLGVISLLILCIAWFNHVNLTTSRLIERTKEIGLRKINGARKGQLILQFFMESVALIGFSIIIASVIVFIFYRWFANTMFFSSKLTTSFDFWIVVISALLVGIFFPSLVIGFSASSVSAGKAALKRNSAGSRSAIRNALVILQFTIIIALITGLGLVNKQLRYIQSIDLGFQQEQVLVLDAPRVGMEEKFVNKLNTFKESLLDYSNIKDVTAAVSVPGERFGSGNGGPKIMGQENTDTYFRVGRVMPNYLDFYGIKLLAGRNFSGSHGNTQSIIINEEALKEFRLKNPEEALLKTVSWNGSKVTIIGVTQSFHQQSLHIEPEPMIIYTMPVENTYNFLFVKLNSNNIGQTIAQIEDKYKALFPGNPYNYFFLDKYFEQQYNKDIAFQKLFSFFSVIALIIGFMGMYGLGVFKILKRTKEIGVLKVNGAKTVEVMFVLNVDFVRWVGIAFLIATPVSYLSMEHWLENFAYRTQMNWWVFALAGGLAIGIALLTVSWQSWRAASRNPVEALRYE